MTTFRRFYRSQFSILRLVGRSTRRQIPAGAVRATCIRLSSLVRGGFWRLDDNQASLTSSDEVWPNAGQSRKCRHRATIAAALAIFTLALLLPKMTLAQVENDTVTGRVTDQTGAVVPKADVTLEQKATGLVLRRKTNDSGIYVFPQLQAGTYQIVATAPGFKKTITSITLTVGQTVGLNLKLHVGAPTSSVTVQAGSSTQLDTQNATLSYMVSTKQMNQLPINGRNPFALATLAPGIDAGNFFGQGLSTTRGAVVAAASNNFKANGGLAGSNDILLDGVSIRVCCQGQPAVIPSMSVLGQFKVVTSTPPAEYGHSSGGFLNIVTKSGTNRLHGNIYEYFRNDALDAANFFTKRSGKYPIPGRNDYTLPHHFNQFGAFVSGPVVIPRLYNGKNKTFFAFGYEGTRNLAPTYHVTTVPTVLMRQGIFTEAPALIYDPNNVAPDPANPGQYTRQPVPAACNGTTCYPAGRYIPNINPIAQKILPLIPLPNSPGVVNNYDYVTNIIDTDNQFNVRLDHDFTPNQRIFIRGTIDHDTHLNYGLFNKPNELTGWTQPLSNYLFAVGDVWTVSPSLLLQLNYGFALQHNIQMPNTFKYFKAGDYGFSSQFTSEQQASGLPYITFNGLTTLGAIGPQFGNDDRYTHSLNAIAELQYGKQLITFGYNGQLNLYNGAGLSDPAGNFNFSTTFTSGPNPNSSLPTGQGPFDSWASFLLGYPSSGGIARQDTVAFNQFYNALFLQDDWRVLPRLTLNLGVRWNEETGLKERNNHWADFNPNATNPLSAYTGIPFTGGVEYLGVNGNPSRAWPTSHLFVPRVGFSYQAERNTVVRGGFAILDLPTEERMFGSGTVGFVQNTPYVATIDGRTPANSINNPFPSGVSLPAGSSAGVAVGAGSSIGALVYNNPVPYEQQWNIGIEQHLPGRAIFSLNYTGSHGVHLPLDWRPNDLNPKYFGAPGDQNQVAYLQQLVSNPFYGSSATGILANPEVQRAQLLAAFPQYASNTSMANGSLNYDYYDHGSASYNALQALVRIDNSHGLSASVSYTWSKSLGNVSSLTTGFLNASNPGIQDYYFLHTDGRSVAATDVPQRVVGYLVYALPFGKGKMFGGNWPAWANRVAGGWTLTSIASVQSGFPLAFGVTGSEPFAGGRPSSVPGEAPLTSGPIEQRLGGAGESQGYLNPAAFRRSLSFELGDVPRSDAAARGPYAFEDDASLIKQFGIFKSLKGEFRLEAFNFLNKVQFGNPGTAVGSSNFGVINSQANLPRNVQAALKIFF